MRAFSLRFGRDRRGGVAVVLALALVPLVGLAGAAVDYARVSDLKSELQKAVDATALATAQGDAPFERRKQAGLAFLEDQLSRYEGVSYDPTIEPVMEDGREIAITVSMTAAVPTRLVSVVGFRSMDVVVESTAATGRDEAYDIAFVLDTTGSMGGTRLDVLKRTTTNLIDDLLERRVDDDQIRVSVIPFGQYVNVGMGNRTQPWIDVPSDRQAPTTRTCEMVREVVDRDCRRVLRPAQPARPRTCYDDGRAYDCSQPARPARWVDECTPIHGPNMVEQCRTRGGGWTRWHGCVGSRNAPNDSRDDTYGIRIPGLMNVRCGSPILEPTSNLARAKAHIRSLETEGETYIPTGLMWGWRALSPHAPIAGRAGQDGMSVRRYMVLVTDGQNTRSPNYPKHDGRNADQANEIMRTTCRNMAADDASDITLFTIAFEVTDPTVKQILEECSSLNGGAFYDAENADALGAAMRHIGGQIGQLRLTH